MANDLPAVPGRPEFTPAHLVQARFSGMIRDRHRQKRRTVTTHPIDNVEPQIASDRDDGIFVEARENGDGYRVHVTIADVAGHVRANSQLAQVARERATTLYGPGRNDPMFPAELENRMSLEHQQERLGMLVSIDLDKNFQPIHTALEPVITHADTSSYAQAQAKMASNPQFQLMHRIADGIEQRYFPPGGMVWDDSQTGRRALRRELPGQEAAMRMVATYMLLANSCVATFFSKSDVPFLYRNFNENSENPRAYYSTVPERHDALERSGLRGAYAHITSPIRRAADFVNGGSMHYAIHVLNEARAGILHRYRSADPEKLRHALWKRGPQILSAIQRAQGDEPTIRGEPLYMSGHFLPKMQLEEALVASLREALPPGTELPRRLDRLMHELLSNPIVQTQQQYEQYAQQVNRINHSDALRQLGRMNEKFDQDREVIASLPTQLEAIDGSKFSSMLMAAARTGALPDALYREALARINTGHFDTTRDGLAILFVAEPVGQEWLELKKATCLAVKHHPGLVNSLMDAARTYLAPALIEEIPVSLPLPDDDRPPEEAANMPVAIVSLRDAPGQTPVAPPFYSYGPDRPAANSHARFSFIESYAFGQLQPISQANLPGLLYAELDMPNRSKEEVVRQMAGSVDATLALDVIEAAEGYQVHARVAGGVFDSPVEALGEDADLETAKRVALRRLLRHPTFKYEVSSHDEEVSAALRPDMLLKELVEEQGLTLEIPRPVSTGGSRAQFVATVKINSPEQPDGALHTYSGKGPSMKRAIRAASVEALEAFGWQLPAHTPSAQSWVTEIHRERGDAGISYGK